MLPMGALHLYVAGEHLANHGPLEHGRATAHARCLTTLHLTAATHIPSHLIPRPTGALYGRVSGLNAMRGKPQRAVFFDPFGALTTIF